MFFGKRYKNKQSTRIPPSLIQPRNGELVPNLFFFFGVETKPRVAALSFFQRWFYALVILNGDSDVNGPRSVVKNAAHNFSGGPLYVVSDRHIWRAVRKVSGTKDYKVLGTHTGIRVCCGRLKFLPLTPLSTCVSRHCTKGENIFFCSLEEENGEEEKGVKHFSPFSLAPQPSVSPPTF